jgi:ectoine hydroxylase-related dioxygenase (phytanoyl-CoA dioxygenase family)
MTSFSEAVDKVSRDGYCRLEGVYSESRVHEALAKVEEWYARSKELQSANVPFLNQDQPVVYNLQSKDIFFLDLLFESELLGDLLVHFMNDSWYKQIPQDRPNYILRAFSARSSNKALPMHIDSFVPYLGPHVFIMQGSIILKDQSEENGCTVVVPGSHLSGEYTNQEAARDAIPLESKAGDVVIWDSRLWHGTTENRSGSPRWAIIATYSRWWLKQHFDIPRSLPQEIYTQLSDDQKAVLGFCSIPPIDESERIDMKTGYEALASDVAAYQGSSRDGENGAARGLVDDEAVAVRTA